MNQRTAKQWDEAYKSSHVCADLCVRVVHADKQPDRELVDWLNAEADALQRTARKLRKKFLT